MSVQAIMLTIILYSMHVLYITEKVQFGVFLMVFSMILKKLCILHFRNTLKHVHLGHKWNSLKNG